MAFYNLAGSGGAFDLLLDELVECAVSLARLADTLAEGERDVLAGDHDAELVDLDHRDLGGAVLISSDDTVGSRAASNDVALEEGYT